MMIGVVLCGGQSIRMGADKGLLHNNVNTWAEVALRNLEAVKLPVFLSLNADQESAYAEIFDSSILIVDDPSLKIGGPLKGILSLHIHQPGNDLLVIGCDMPEMHSDVLEHLISKALADDAEAVVFRHDGYIEPLCAVYTASGLHKIHQLYLEGGLNRFSLHHVLGVLNTRYLPMPPEWKPYFFNVNTPEDLAGK